MKTRGVEVYIRRRRPDADAVEIRKIPHDRRAHPHETHERREKDPNAERT